MTSCSCSFPYELLFSLMGLVPHLTYKLPVLCLQAIEMVKSAVTNIFMLEQAEHELKTGIPTPTSKAFLV